MNNTKGLIFFVPLLLIACSSVPPQSQQDQVSNDKVKNIANNANSSKATPVVYVNEQSIAISAPKAVLSLIERSQQQISEGDLTGARTSLERALRITPRYPDSYYYLAKVNYLEGQYALARSMAKKCLSLGAQDNLLESVLVLLGDIHISVTIQDAQFSK